MKFYYYIFLIIMFAFFSQFLFVEKSGAEDMENKIAHKFWQALKEIQVEPLKDNNSDNDEYVIFLETQHYWKTLQSACENEFLKSLREAEKNNEIESFAKMYVSFFGKNGNDADIRWVLACPLLTSNSHLIADEGKDLKKLLGNKYIVWQFQPAFRRFACEFNKSIVYDSLSSPDFYQRVYWFTLWVGDYPYDTQNKNIHIDSLGIVCELINNGLAKSKADPQYWFAMRHALILAYLCRLEHIFYNDSKTPLTDEEIKKRVKDVGEHYRMLASTRIIYSSDEVRYVSCNARMPPFELPKMPFSDNCNNNLLFENIKQINLPDKVNILTHGMFIGTDMHFNHEFLKKVTTLVQ